MNGEDHLIGLGKVIGNLHTLEVLLRVFLSEAHGQDSSFPIKEAEVPLTHLTNFMSLGELIDEYNEQLLENESAFAVLREVVEIRDALAHGRLTSLTTSFPLTLHRFGKPRAGKVPVKLTVLLSKEWFDRNRQLVRTQLENVINCARHRHFTRIGQSGA